MQCDVFFAYALKYELQFASLKNENDQIDTSKNKLCK